MLLAELLKHTAPHHPDYNQLEQVWLFFVTNNLLYSIRKRCVRQALEKVIDLADNINESVRAAESVEQVKALQKKVGGLSIALNAPGWLFPWFSLFVRN